MNIRGISFLLLIILTICDAQPIVLNHTGGPMGGIVGDIGITSNGDIYAGVYSTFVPYSGLYKSTDNGESWNKVITQFEDFEVYAIYITEEDHIWIGTNFQERIYCSTDNGQTWQNKRNGYDTGECWAFGESKDGVLFAGDGQYFELYRSTDYGENWEFSANLRPMVFATDSNNSVYAGTHDGLFVTTDNGLTWTQNNFLADIPVSTILIDSNNNLYCGTGYYDNGNGIFYSTDNGENWTQLGLADKIVLSLAIDSEGNLLAGTKKDALFKTTDGGQSWAQFHEGLYRKEVFRLKLNNQDNLFIGSENEGVFRSTNNGNSFNHIGLPISKVNNIVFSGDSLIFSSTSSGVQKYNRSKNEWKNTGLQNVETVSITQNNILYAGTFDDGLYKTTDLGDSWHITNLTIDSIMSVYNVLAVNDEVVFAGTEFNLRKSTDGGISWSILPIQTDFFSRGMYLNYPDIYVTGYGTTNYILYKLEDFGASIESLFSGFDNIFQNQLTGTTNNYLFIGEFVVGGSFYKSSDSGNTWTTSLDNLCSSIYASDSGQIIVASDSLYISSDYGTSWQSVFIPLKTTNKIIDIKKDSNGKLFFASSTNGLYEVDLITHVNEDIPMAENYFLSQNYPNPFNPETTIKYSIPNPALVQIKVYDVIGREIYHLLNEYKPAGTHEVEFDGTELSSGVYLYRITSGSYSESKKMLLLN